MTIWKPQMLFLSAATCMTVVRVSQRQVVFLPLLCFIQIIQYQL